MNMHTLFYQRKKIIGQKRINDEDIEFNNLRNGAQKVKERMQKIVFIQ